MVEVDVWLCVCEMWQVKYRKELQMQTSELDLGKWWQICVCYCSFDQNSTWVWVVLFFNPLSGSILIFHPFVLAAVSPCVLFIECKVLHMCIVGSGWSYAVSFLISLHLIYIPLSTQTSLLVLLWGLKTAQSDGNTNKCADTAHDGVSMVMSRVFIPTIKSVSGYQHQDLCWAFKISSITVPPLFCVFFNILCLLNATW